ncbi:Nodulin MtN21/EamA-like transporter family protein [Quillaja saponaria]|uniref:Nodulin MtN21/EamA-like transporter family protein n=1 Tax=Quillaja saponaria TaxID=32244 RepID=A0AAD7LLF7_QUISA|nr:Nodulin MtN21/EamA-like transporter family protein [Quillaja saponaria]
MCTVSICSVADWIVLSSPPKENSVEENQGKLLRLLDAETGMASAESNDVDHVVELIVRDASPSTADADADSVSDEIAPLLTQVEKPKINIFTLSYPRKKPRDQLRRIT